VEDAVRLIVRFVIGVTFLAAGASQALAGAPAHVATGSGRTGAATLGGGALSDFTGDAKSDILWRHATNGDVWLWPMNGPTRVSETFVRAVPDTNWEIRSLADQNGDGKADLMWRNKANGQLYFWPMDGSTWLDEIYVGTVATDYDIVGAGDFDGDGKGDLLWRNLVNGQVWIWLMDGATPTSRVLVGRADPGYAVRGVGDVDGDGKADLVWHHPTTGEVWVWLMDGTTKLSEAWVATVPDTGYQIQGVADFTGDARADLVWWHVTRGEVWIWTMNGAARQAETWVATVPETDYRIVGAGDYDGNGKADILWYHATRGEVWTWIMDGTTRVSETWVATVPDAGYQVVNAQAPRTSIVPGSPRVATVSLTVSLLSLQVGQTLQLAATPRDQAGDALTGRVVSWFSRNARIASVSPTGLVSALAAGAVEITASVEGRTATSTITVTTPGEHTFDFSREILGTPGTLFAWLVSLDGGTGQVEINGVDTSPLSAPFTFDWGDGSTTNAYYPQSHTYGSTSRNYVLRVTAHYSGGGSDDVELVIRFVAPQLTSVPFPAELAVTIPNPAPVLGTRLYPPPSNLLGFDDSFFGPMLGRQDVEYLLSQAAAVQYAILAGDVERVDGAFHEVILRDPTFSGAYSLWFTTPVSFAANDTYFQGTPGYSSLLHEMGHNFSLNAPAAFRYGGRIDGPANAIFSEAVAQMFQHATAYELVNNGARYGLPADLSQDIAESSRMSARIVRTSYDQYVSQGCPFAAWNDEATPQDETFGTFMTLARQFLVHAEQAQSYLVPLSRAMRLLRTFNQEMHDEYAPQTNSTAASTYRATLMVAALSYGFGEDLRAEFRALNFPIDDALFARLYSSVE
jgi:hypothetical protein